MSTITGTSDNDTLVGTSNPDFIKALSGDDTITAGDGNDTVAAAGDDTVDGGLGNDTLVGGFGTDRLKGASGDDKYTFAVGDGSDFVTDSSSAADELVFGGITDVNDMWFSQQNDDLLINVVGSDDQVKVLNWFETSGDFKIEQITIGNGSRSMRRVWKRWLPRWPALQYQAA